MFPLLMGIPTDGGTRSAELKGSQQSTFFMRHQERAKILLISMRLLDTRIWQVEG
jgi:hypothetical protein